MIAPADPISLEEFYHDTFEPLRLLGKAERTREEYHYALTHWARFAGDLPVGRIDDVLLAKFAGSLLTTRRPATVNKTIRHVMAVVRLAHRRGLLGEVPEVTRLREELSEPRAFLLDEISRLLKAVATEPGTICGIPAGDWWRSLLLACFDTGARIGALLAVPTSAVSLDSACLTLPASAQKNRRAQTVWLHPQTVAACRVIWDASRGLLWPWPFGQRVVYKHLRRIAERAGVQLFDEPGRLFHRFRRSCASYMEAAGMDATRQLGHSRRSVTARYIDPRIARTQSAVDVLPRPHLD